MVVPPIVVVAVIAAPCHKVIGDMLADAKHKLILPDVDGIGDDVSFIDS